MTPKQITLLCCACFILAATTAGLTLSYVVSTEKTQVLHDQLLISETKLETIQENYNELLKHINATETPFVPYTLPTLPRPNGNVGDK